MVLYFIGLGLNDEKDISLKGLETIKECDEVYLEYYTCILHTTVKKMQELYQKEIILANREMVEQKADETILKDAKKKKVAFLVIGDALSATTHHDLLLRAKEKKIKTLIIPNASVFSAIGLVGLQLYKFGRTSSITFYQDNFKVITPYNNLKENLKNGLHSLFLLDIKVDEGRFMTIPQAIEELLRMEKEENKKIFTKDTLCIGVARLGSEKPIIKYGKAKDLLKENFGAPLHSLIIPGNMHFMEEDYLDQFKV